jgi:hypothetical protein
MFAYFTPTKADGTPLTKTERCLNAVQLVAVFWMMPSMFLNAFSSNLPFSPDVRQRLGILGLICTMISLALFTVLLPLRHILLKKDPK